MTVKIDFERWTGRRISLRDLAIFRATAELGSMSKAAVHLRIAQPTVSEAIANLERIFSVALLDRMPHGVELTVYGAALLNRSVAAFDELKQSASDIAFLAGSQEGELRIGHQESLSPSLLAPAARKFSDRYPGVVLHIDELPYQELQIAELRARKYDCMLALLSRPVAEDDLNVETLFNDRLGIAVDLNSRWARRRSIDLARLVDEPWILTAPGTWNYGRLEEAFRARGLGLPRTRLSTMSYLMRAHVIAGSDYIAAFNRSSLEIIAKPNGLKILNVDLNDPPWPAVLITLKHRTLSPVAERFLAVVREVAKGINVSPRLNSR